MSDPAPFRVADLAQTRSTAFVVEPDADARSAIAAQLELSALRKLRLTGTIEARGKRDWLLQAKLGATIVQPCSVTLEPVMTRIDVPVTRLFVADMPEVNAPEVEVPDDDTQEPLGTHIDVAAVMVEALSLELPEYPRAPDAALKDAVFTEPGKTPLRDEDTKPFAALAALKNQLDPGNEQ